MPYFIIIFLFFNTSLYAGAGWNSASPNALLSSEQITQEHNWLKAFWKKFSAMLGKPSPSLSCFLTLKGAVDKPAFLNDLRFGVLKNNDPTAGYVYADYLQDKGYMVASAALRSQLLIEQMKSGEWKSFDAKTYLDLSDQLRQLIANHPVELTQALVRDEFAPILQKYPNLGLFFKHGSLHGFGGDQDFYLGFKAQKKDQLLNQLLFPPELRWGERRMAAVLTGDTYHMMTDGLPRKGWIYFLNLYGGSIDSIYFSQAEMWFYQRASSLFESSIINHRNLQHISFHKSKVYYELPLRTDHHYVPSNFAKTLDFREVQFFDGAQRSSSPKLENMNLRSFLDLVAPTAAWTIHSTKFHDLQELLLSKTDLAELYPENCPTAEIFRNLRILDLSDTPLQTSSIDRLLSEVPDMKFLKLLDLRGVKLTSEQRKTIQKINDGGKVLIAAD